MVYSQKVVDVCNRLCNHDLRIFGKEVRLNTDVWQWVGCPGELTVFQLEEEHSNNESCEQAAL